MPSTFRPPGGAHINPAASAAAADTTPTPPAPANQAVSEQLQVVENLKSAVDALQIRLTVQEQTNKSLAQASDKLVGDGEVLRKVDSHEEEYRMAKPCRRYGDKIKTDKKKRAMKKDKALHKDEQASAASASSSDDSAFGSNPTSSDGENSDTTDTTSSDDGHGPPGPPSVSSGSSPSQNSSESDSTARKRGPVPNKRKEKIEKADRIKVIRPANGRFKTPLDFRTYFLIRSQVTYTPKQA